MYRVRHRIFPVPLRSTVSASTHHKDINLDLKETSNLCLQIIFSEDLEILSSLISNVVTNRLVENNFRAMYPKKMSKFYVVIAKNVNISASTRHKTINEGLNESLILWL